jgi:hypothetical protein
MIEARPSRPLRAIGAVALFLDALSCGDVPAIEARWHDLGDWGLATPHLRALRETVRSGLPLVRCRDGLFALGRGPDDWARAAGAILVALEGDYGPLDEIVVVVGLGAGDRMAFNVNAGPGLYVIGIDDGALRGPSCASILAHELSHCFFRSGCRFLDEGIAVLNQARFPPPPAAFVPEADRPDLVARQAPLRRSLAAMLLAPEGDALFSAVSASEDSRQFTYVYAERLMDLLSAELSPMKLRKMFDACGAGVPAIRAVEDVLQASLGEIEGMLFAAPAECRAADVIASAEQASARFFSNAATVASTRAFDTLFDLAVRTRHIDALRLASRWSAYRLFGALSRGGGGARWLGRLAQYLMSMTPRDNPDWHLLDGATQLIEVTQPWLPRADDDPSASPAARAEASYLRGLVHAPADPHLSRALSVLRDRQARYAR